MARKGGSTSWDPGKRSASDMDIAEGRPRGKMNSTSTRSLGGIGKDEGYKNMSSKVEKPENGRRESEVTKVIRWHGWGFVYREVKDYIPSFIREFYENMEIKKSFNQMLLSPEDSDGKNFTLGNLNDNYRTMNKIVHYNIRPKGSEKLLGKKEIACLHMVMGDRVFDASWMIWEVIQDFWTVTSNMGFVSAKWERPMVGPTTEASQEKRKSLSKSDIPTSSIQGSFRKKVDIWMKALFCHQNDIMDDQKEAKKEREEIRKRQERIERRMNYCVQTLGESSDNGYKSPLEEVAMEQVQEVRSKRRNEIVEEREEVEEDENEEESEDETGDDEEEDEGSEDIEDENGEDE
ncbi:uncharacterized protein LOC130775368 [Actinidia eriantha]|uniref:uncharacterized protein LOC130775368 n=1 Tax=Actinidia eriantha TaxID=165200 RepID=UPI0025868C13|nr:uncharacterized protein LOC130775368 [Actinidia eriantha]